MKRCLSQNTVSRHQWYERNGAMLLWIVYFKFLLKTDRVCYGAVPFEPTCQTGSSLWPRYIISFLSFEGLFVQSVFKSHLLPSLVPPSFPRPQSDNFPQQKFFFPIFYITQGFPWVETYLQNIPSIQLFFNFPTNMEKLPLTLTTINSATFSNFATNNILISIHLF